MNPEQYVAKITRADLVHGVYYIGRCRNAKIARWNATKGVFIHWRQKFSMRFLEEIKHPEDESDYDVFVVDRPANLDEVSESDEISFEEEQDE